MKLVNKIKVAIDSPAAAGAGTQAKLISKHFNLFYLDTGKIYRLIAKEWGIDVTLNDEIIGKHSFKQVGNESHSLAKFKFKFMLMNFSYEHDSKETWNEDCLKSILSKTNDDGDLFNVSGNKSNGNLKVSSNG